MKRISIFGAALFAASILCPAQPAPDREELLSIPDVSANPFDIQKVSEKEQDGVIVEELFINGAPFGGKPTKIYAFYARPKAPGKYPAVVQLHGSGLQVLKPEAAIEYAKLNYACITLDWAGPDWKSEGVIRPGPRSDFASVGSGAISVPDGDGDPKRTHFESVEPAESSITNGVRFVRRAFQFLRSRPEVDADKLCLSGMSAGAHLSLLVLGVEPGIKAAAVKYGSGFIRELNWGGYYGPISISRPPEGAARWLSVLDPKHGIPSFKAATLILSGTDDIFFKMPAVLATWRAIPSRKALLMLPNDNHSQVGNEVIPRQWFDYILNGTPEWPSLDAAKAEEKPDGLELSVVVRGNISKVSFWYKRMPAKTFNYERGKTPGETVPWVSVDAEKAGDNWSASLPALVAREKVMAYAMAEDSSGTQASSDAVEVKSTAKPGAPPAPAPQKPDALAEPALSSAPQKSLPDGNCFLDPSFEEGPIQKGPSGTLYLNMTGSPAWIEDAKRAHTGAGALQVNDKNGIASGAPAEEGGRYKLSGWFRTENEEATTARLQINWQRQDGSLIKYDLATPKLTSDYQEYVLSAEAPPETAGCVIFVAAGGDGSTLVDDVFYGPEK
ncbi:MAG: alpha/beta hydrolase family protein [Terrimicrobiaceae bacterium]